MTITTKDGKTYASRREFYEASEAERKEAAANRDAGHADLHRMAAAAGRAAAAACTPTPMVVVGYEDQPVMGGVCGYAGVIMPGTESFARWAMKTGLGSKGYPKGTQIWIGRNTDPTGVDYGQSMELKAAYAGAYAAVLREAGIPARAWSKED